MAFFQTIAHSSATSTLKVRYPLFKEVRRQLALLLLDRFDGGGLAELLAAEAGRSHDDSFAAVRESAAGAVLSALLAAPIQSWIDATVAAVDRMGDDRKPAEGHHATAADLLLAVSVLSGDRAAMTRARDHRWKHRPNLTECAHSALLLAECEARTGGAAHAAPDLSSYAALGLQSSEVPALALCLARDGTAPPPSIVGGAAALDAALCNPQGKLRVRTAQKPTWHWRRPSGAPRLELSCAITGDGPTVDEVPWAIPPDLLGPWRRLDELCRGEVAFGTPDGRGPDQRPDELLRSADGEIRLAVQCQGVSLSDAGVAALRGRLPAGERWLRALHPWLQARVTLDVESA